MATLMIGWQRARRLWYPVTAQRDRHMDLAQTEGLKKAEPRKPGLCDEFSFGEQEAPG